MTLKGWRVVKPQHNQSKPADTGGLKYWVKRHLRTLGRALANLASKASATLNGIIGLIVSWLLGTLGKPVVWLAENLWAVDVNAVTLFLMAAQDWLTQHRGVSRPLPHDKQNVTRASAIPAVTRAVFFFFLLHGPLNSFDAVAAPQSGWKPPVLFQRHRAKTTARPRRSRQVPCEQSRLVGWFSLEYLIAFGSRRDGCTDRFRLVYPWAVADQRVRPGDYDIVIIALYVPRMELHRRRGEVAPNSKDEAR